MCGSMHLHTTTLVIYILSFKSDAFVVALITVILIIFSSSAPAPTSSSSSSFVLFVCLPSLYVVFLSFITSVNMVPFENGDFGIDVDRHLNTHKPIHHTSYIHPSKPMRCDASTNCKCTVQIIHCATVKCILFLIFSRRFVV